MPVLTSWKDIATHLGKGVRTVQRWEGELGLPVRRTKQEGKAIVLAIPEEIDDWVHSQRFQNGRCLTEQILKQLRIENQTLRGKLSWISELTSEELSIIEASAKAQRLSVPEWIRERLKLQPLRDL
jgi:hypothetical protein